MYICIYMCKYIYIYIHLFLQFHLDLPFPVSSTRVATCRSTWAASAGARLLAKLQRRLESSMACGAATAVFQHLPSGSSWHKKLLKMAIEIVDLATKHGDFP